MIETYRANRLLVTDYHPISREPTVEVAHEALLREWPRLREWLDEDRDAIRVRRGIAVAAGEWREQGRDESVLFRGQRLVSADDITSRLTLAPGEQEFLAVSHQLADREQAQSEQRAVVAARQNRRLRRLLVGNGRDPPRRRVVGGRFRGHSAPERNRQTPTRATTRRTKRSRAALRPQANTLVSTNRGVAGLLLAVEAQRFARPGSERSSATAGGPRRVAAVGRGGAVRSPVTSKARSAHRRRSSFSPDGKYLISNSNVSGLRVWDAATRRPIAHQPVGSGAG